MPTFKHDPSRVHPPATEGGYPSVGEEELVPLPRSTAPAAPTTLEGEEIAEAPRTQSTYSNIDARSHVSLSLGEIEEPHRIVWMYSDREVRDLGRVRELVEQALSDMDHDQRNSMVYVRNYEPDCDPLRLTNFFQSLGYSLQSSDPYPELYRAAQPYVEPAIAPEEETPAA